MSGGRCSSCGRSRFAYGPIDEWYGDENCPSCGTKFTGAIPNVIDQERDQNQRAFVRLLAWVFFAVALVAFMAVQLIAAGGAVMIPVLIFAVAGVWVTR